MVESSARSATHGCTPDADVSRFLCVRIASCPPIAAVCASRRRSTASRSGFGRQEPLKGGKYAPTYVAADDVQSVVH